ncbi:tripartite tricarboxylate transporter permease [Rhodovulum iodosum]|nr:tripartite tricarboxylate transporter permease [Rhodovulum robiginosum]
MAIGVLPGIGALATISILLPFTFSLDPTHGMIMLAGIFYGAQYGGSVASILLNLPGTASTAVTALDGYPMTKAGRAGVALFVTTIVSFLGGSFAILLMTLVAPGVASLAREFGSTEYFSIMLLALVAAATLAPGSMLKGLAMVAFGLLLGTVGTDMTTGSYRFTFGMLSLADGLSLVIVVMGLFGVAEILSNLAGGAPPRPTQETITLRSMLPTREDLRRSIGPTWRGSLVGVVTGILPGLGPQVASFVAYATEKRLSDTPEQFGTGMIEGVTAPEAANNAAVQAAFIPTLTLGIPGDAVMAVMMGALMLHGILPGPSLITNEPDLFWGLVASFWIGNVILLLLNIPLIGLWLNVLRVPYRLLYPAILALICIGVFSLRNNPFDIVLVVVFGVIGYGMGLLRLPPAPLLLGLVLGPLVEEHLRRALIIGRGDPMVFLQSPISLAALVATVVLIAATARRKPPVSNTKTQAGD